MSKTENLTVRTLSILNVRSGQAEADSWYHPAHLLKEGTSAGALVVASSSPPVKGEDGTLRFSGEVVIARTAGGSAAVVPEKALPSVRAYLQGLVSDPAADEPLTLKEAVKDEEKAALLRLLPEPTRAAIGKAQTKAMLKTLRGTLDSKELEKAAKERIKLTKDGRNRLTSLGIANREK